MCSAPARRAAGFCGLGWAKEKLPEGRGTVHGPAFAGVSRRVTIPMVAVGVGWQLGEGVCLLLFRLTTPPPWPGRLVGGGGDGLGGRKAGVELSIAMSVSSMYRYMSIFSPPMRRHAMPCDAMPCGWCGREQRFAPLHHHHHPVRPPLALARRQPPTGAISP